MLNLLSEKKFLLHERLDITICTIRMGVYIIFCRNFCEVVEDHELLVHGLGRLENVCKSLAEHSVVAAPHNILFALTYLPTMHQPEPEPAEKYMATDGMTD